MESNQKLLSGRLLDLASVHKGTHLGEGLVEMAQAALVLEGTPASVMRERAARVNRTRLLGILGCVDDAGFLRANAQDLKALQRLGFCTPGGGMATTQIITESGRDILAIIDALEAAQASAGRSRFGLEQPEVPVNG